MKAQAKVEDLAVDGDLGNIDEVVSQMLSSVPEAEKVKTSSAAELTQLIKAIKNGAASNNQSARFLEIVTKLAR